MNLLYEIMQRTRGWNTCWWLNDPDNSILWHARDLGLVFRQSVTQVGWTDKGIRLLRKYTDH